MPTIWKNDYLKNHTEKEYIALQNSYLDADWQCPRCSEVNMSWHEMTLIAGRDDWGTKFSVNNDCYGCGYRRKNSTLFNLKPGQKPKKKPRDIKPTQSCYLRFNGDKRQPKTPTKVWDAQLYKSSKKVVTRWGRAYGNGTGTRKEFTFKTEKEAVEFYEKKVAEKLNKGYYDPFYSESVSKIQKSIKSKTAAKRATSVVKSRTKKKSTKKSSVKKPTKAKRPTRKATTNRKTSSSRKTTRKG